MSETGIPWKRLTLEIDSRLEAVPLLGQVMYLVCTAAGFAPVDGNLVEVCVVEAINNSIAHACQGDPAYKVKLDVNLSPTQLIVDVWDSGLPGDAAKIHADHSSAFEVHSDRVHDISERGRGLAVIQEVMDSFEYTPGTRRNRFRMIKRRDLPPLGQDVCISS